MILTLPPEAETPLGSGDLAVLVGVAGVEEGPDADLVLVQVDGRQFSLVQVQVAVGVQLGEHPAYGVLTARH